jgi:hypothetical protein
MTPDTELRSVFAEFAARLGLPSMVLNDLGVASLLVDGRSCHVAEQRDALVVTVTLGPHDGQTEVFARLLEANFAAATLGIGTVGLDARLGTLCLVERISTEGLTGDALARTFEAIFNRADDWSQLIQQAQRRQDAEAPGFEFIRV